MTATAVGQLVGFAVAPFLSRLYSPAEFGVMGVFLSISAALGVVAALRLELAVVVPASDEDAKDVMAAATLVVGTVAVLTTVVVALAALPISRLLGVPELAPLLGWLPLYVSSLGVFQVFNYWSTRVGMFGRLASAQVTRAVGAAVGQLGLGVMGAGVTGLLAGHVGGQVMGNLTLLGRSALGGGRVLRTPVSVSGARRVLKEYFEFAAYGAPQALVNSLSQGLPAIVLTAAFGAAPAGQFLLATRVMAVPSNLLGQSFRQVLYPHLSRRMNDPGVLRFSLRVTGLLGLLALVPVVLLAAYGPALFTWVFGEEWRVGGVFARYLGVVIATSLMNIPAVSLVPLLRMQRWHAGYELFYLAGRVGALVVGGQAGGAVGAVIGIVIAGVVFNATLIVVVLSRLRRHLADQTGM